MKTEPPPTEALRVFDCPLDGIRLVEASAGTGKTWNICALYLRLLLERGLEPAAILVVTFSVAATAELRERIRERLLATRAALRADLDGSRTDAGADPFIRDLLAHLATLRDVADDSEFLDDSDDLDDPAELDDLDDLEDRDDLNVSDDLDDRDSADSALHSLAGPLRDGRQPVALDPASLLARIERAIETFDEAAIFTIHGFCQRALADAPFGAGLPLQLDQAPDGPLIEQVATDFWRQRLIAPDSNPILAAALVSAGDSPQAWAELLKRRLGHPLSTLVWPDDVDPGAIGTTADPGADASLASARRMALDRLAEVAASWSPIPIRAVLDSHLPRLRKNSYSPEKLDDALANWAAWLDPVDPAAREGLVFEGAVAEPIWKRMVILGAAALGKATLKAQPAIEPLPFFAAVDAFIAARDALAAATTSRRLALLARFLDEGPATLRERKRERREIAFDDMLANLYRRLYGLDGLAGSGEALAELLRQRYPAALIDEFQDTDPQQFAIFERIYAGTGLPLFFVGDPKQAIYAFRGADLPTYLKARGRAEARYTLATNQRATARLIDGLEAVLNRNPAAFVLDGLHYQPVSVGPRPRSRFVEPATADQAGSDGPALRLWTLPQDPRTGEWLAKPAAVDASIRACAAEIVRLLAGGLDGSIRVAERPLRGGDIAILVPKHDWGRRMRQALAERGVPSVELSQDSVFASTDAEDLARVLAAIEHPARTGLVLAALATDAMGVDAARIAAIRDDDAALGQVMARFAGYREHWRRFGIASLLRHWMRAEGVVSRLLGRADGERRMTNLMHLAEALQQASRDLVGADALLRWFEAQRAGLDPAGADSAQLRLESDRHLVQILTIHRSKGLEFPIVFCPFLWDGHPRKADAGEGISIHDAADDSLLVFRALTADEKAAARLEAVAEQVRLLYVALTRAVHRCYLVIGCYLSRGTPKESQASPLNWLVAGAGFTPEAWFDSSPKRQLPTPDELADAWASVAALAPEAISIEPLPERPFVRLAPPPADPMLFAALAPPRRPPAGRRVGSYSSLTQGDAAEGAARDRDLFIGDGNPARDRPTADDILLFARGPVAGECLHSVFEHTDFTDPDSRADAIRRALLAYPQVVPPGGDAASTGMLGRMLDDVLATPLVAGSSLRLDRIERGRRLDELEFMLPARQLRPASLAALMASHGYPVPTLATSTLTGWLRGFIDLVFEHDGRYYVLDWKSNHLGSRAEDYGAAATAAAMRAHDYHLQALLYTVALHRFLRQRLPDYQQRQHLGGYFYLFVRGVRPAWRQADGAPAGVVFERPDPALVDALDRLLGATDDDPGPDVAAFDDDLEANEDFDGNDIDLDAIVDDEVESLTPRARGPGASARTKR